MTWVARRSESRSQQCPVRRVCGRAVIIPARKDLGTVINLFVKRVKKVNANTTETALRLSDLENRFSSKARQIEERHSSIFEREDYRSRGQTDDLVEDATPKGADGPVPIETNTDSESAGAFEASATPVEESSGEARIAN
jgi:hypothetical protein